MSIQPKMSIEQENTQRFISRANRLGYIIVEIETDSKNLWVTIIPADDNSYTPILYRHWDSKEWKIETTAYGTLGIEQIEKVTEGYQRAIAMVHELNHLSAGGVVNYKVTN